MIVDCGLIVGEKGILSLLMAEDEEDYKIEQLKALGKPEKPGVPESLDGPEKPTQKGEPGKAGKLFESGWMRPGVG